MNIPQMVARSRHLERRIELIVELGCRRDYILEAPELDVEALRILAADYEAAGLKCTAGELRRRIDYYQIRKNNQ